MLWNKNKCSDNKGIMKHPTNFETWKYFDKDHKNFSLDPRNVRLELTSDDCHLFGNTSNA